jgi:cyanophycinase-like exopeptidase
MIKLTIKLIFCVLVVNICHAQNTVYSLGNLADTITNSRRATILMGGATENDSIMKKFLQYANGGDVVVIRASGADGYNQYFYQDLGVPIHSVQTFVINSIAGANDSTLVQAVRNAEALWIAGGNQANYVNFWRGTALNTSLNYLLNTKHVPFGGTSAGMAIQGGFYYSAINGSATSNAVLNNPYDATVTVDNTPFLGNPLLKDIITDTHFDNPDRRGRLMTFIARVKKDLGKDISAIACDEYTAVWIDSTGQLTCYGDQAGDFAYYVTIDCEGNNTIEECTNGNVLNWAQDGKVVKTYQVQGTNQGAGSFNITNFNKQNISANGGTWQDWSVVNGTFASNIGVAPNCATNLLVDNKMFIKVYPNPVNNTINISNIPIHASINIYNLQGILMQQCKATATDIILPCSTFNNGLYYLVIIDKEQVQKIPIFIAH